MKRVYYAIIIALLTFALWEIANRPVDAPHWSDLIEGVAYSPMRPGQSPITGELPTEAEIEADIEIIAAHAKSIRTYGVDGTLARIPEIAAKHLLAITVGVTLTGDAETDRLQLDQLLTVASNNTNIERIIIGNETLLTEKLTPTALTEYLTEIRTQLDQQVLTGHGLKQAAQGEVATNPFQQHLELLLGRSHDASLDQGRGLGALPFRNQLGEHRLRLFRRQVQ